MKSANPLLALAWLAGAIATPMFMELGQSPNDAQEMLSRLVIQLASGAAWGYTFGCLTVGKIRRRIQG